MFDRDEHLSDEELILAADDEISLGRCSAVRSHLSACWTCRARMQEIEQNISDLVRMHRDDLNQQPFDYTTSRAKLQARLEQLPAQPALISVSGFFRSFAGQWNYAFAVALVLFASVLMWRHTPHVLRSFTVGRGEFSSLPNPHLTPGAVRPVTVAQVCSSQREEVIRAVPVDLQAQVVREYGLRSPKPQDYEVDYLITPGLGGADQISNLWPEPYSGTWNAHLKDMLEQRLHEMVCDKQITLESAQHDIASDWIAAYKKYIPANQSAGNDATRPVYALVASR